MVNIYHLNTNDDKLIIIKAMILLILLCYNL